MNVDTWCRELPDLAHFVLGAPQMLGEAWHAGGRHRYRLRIPLVHRDPFGGVKEAAARLGVRTEWNKNAGWMNLEGEGWKGFSSIGGGPELALGEHLELLVEQRTDEARAQAGARALALCVAAFVPFAQLCDEQGATLDSAVHLQFAGGHDFGYLSFGREGLGAFLADHLEGWLRSHGIHQQFEGDETRWSIDGRAQLLLTRSDASPDTLRVDIAGLDAFEAKRATGAADVSGPRTAEAVFQRALCLWLVRNRTTVEAHWKNVGEAMRTRLEQRDADLLGWADDEGLFAALSAGERAGLFQPLGTWNKPQVMNAGWRIEALGALTWALGWMAELPTYGTPMSGEALGDVFGSFEPMAALRARAHLRPREALIDARAVAEEWIARTGAAAEASAAAADLTSSLQRSTALERAHALNWILEGGIWP